MSKEITTSVENNSGLGVAQNEKPAIGVSRARVEGLERLVTSLIDSVERVEHAGVLPSTGESNATQDLLRKVETLQLVQQQMLETLQLGQHQVDKLNEDFLNRILGVEGHADRLTDLPERFNSLEIRVNQFYESLNYLNRFQIQADAMSDRIERTEKLLQSIGVDLRSSESRLEAVLSSRIESRLRSVEYTLSNFVSPWRFLSAVKRKVLRKFGRQL